ncbi:DUF6274 family protein [Actinacidiphila oryziradicis]|uniref:DUF6274 family protein n=1 Tax=Actinacidiphila oryziradicis TaxID=2571141 RepID=UPI003211DB62
MTMTSGGRPQRRALLRAHLAASAGRGRHLTRHCPVCHRLLRLALESPEGPLPHGRKQGQEGDV